MTDLRSSIETLFKYSASTTSEKLMIHRKGNPESDTVLSKETVQLRLRR